MTKKNKAHTAPFLSEMKVYGRQVGRAYKLNCRMTKCLYDILQLCGGPHAFGRTEMAQPILNVIQRSCIGQNEFPEAPVGA